LGRKPARSCQEQLMFGHTWMSQRCLPST
jgi:hypothetical protein